MPSVKGSSPRWLRGRRLAKMNLETLRVQSLITGGLQNGKGGKWSVTPTKSAGGGSGKSYAEGGGGAQQVLG